MVIENGVEYKGIELLNPDVPIRVNDGRFFDKQHLALVFFGKTVETYIIDATDEAIDSLHDLYEARDPGCKTFMRIDLFKCIG